MDNLELREQVEFLKQRLHYLETVFFSGYFDHEERLLALEDEKKQRATEEPPF